MSTKGSMLPIVSKMYCSSSQVLLMVRKRPHVINGGGFVVTDSCQNNVVFKVDGCGVLGSKDELVLKDAKGNPLLLIRRKGGIVEALSIQRTWKGYSYEGLQKPVFTLKEPYSCFVKNNTIRISIDGRTTTSNNQGKNFEIRGYFPDKNCAIVDSKGNIVAQVGVKKELKEMMANRDIYHVIIKPGFDQAFVFGVIAVLDYIYGESTRC